MVNAKLLKDLDEVLETKNRTIIMGVVNLSLDLINGLLISNFKSYFL